VLGFVGFFFFFWFFFFFFFFFFSARYKEKRLKPPQNTSSQLHGSLLETHPLSPFGGYIFVIFEALRTVQKCLGIEGSLW